MKNLTPAKYSVLSLTVTTIILLTLLFAGVSYGIGGLCLFVKRAPTFKVFFQVPADYSGEESYLRSIESLPPYSPKRLAVEEYRRVVDLNPCNDGLPRFCFGEI